MRTIVIIILLYILVLPAIVIPSTTQNQLVVVPPESGKPALNKGCGLMLSSIHHYRQSKEWDNDYISIAYGRFNWSTLEPKRGKYNFDGIETWRRNWKKKGFRVSFGVVSMSGSRSRQSTPKWAFDEGLEFVVHKAKKGTNRGKLIKDPIFWDDDYLKKYSGFVKALGTFLHGGNEIESIDIRGLGSWGEMHLIGYSKNDLKNSQFDIEQYAELYKKMIDLYCDAFPKTQLFLNLGHLYKKMYPYVDLAEYAASKGVGLRFDGLEKSYTYSGQKIASTLFRKYSNINSLNNNIIPTLYEFARGENETAIISQCLDNALSDRVSYIHLNLGPLFNLNPIAIKKIKEVSLKIGYRFVIDRFSIATQCTLNDKSNIIPFNLTMSNRGIASCRFNSTGRFFLINQDHKPVYKVSLEMETVRLHSENAAAYSGAITLPETIQPGDYYLAFSLSRENDLNDNISLGNLLKNHNGQYILLAVKIVIDDKGKKITCSKFKVKSPNNLKIISKN